MLRNWLTYMLRFCIHQQEALAYHNKLGLANEKPIRDTYNAQVKREALQNQAIYASNGREDQFITYYTVNDVLASKTADGEWQIATIFQ